MIISQLTQHLCGGVNTSTVYRLVDLVNILARILDSKRNFNLSADPMITADHGFIQILGAILDFGC